MTDLATNSSEGVPVSEGGGAATAAAGAVPGLQSGAGGTQVSSESAGAEVSAGAGQMDSAGAEGGVEAPEGSDAPVVLALAAPEGHSMDASVLREFEGVASELGLSQASAQRVLDVMAPVMAARQTEAIAALRSEWVEGARADREFGGDRLDVSLGVARRALDAFGSPALMVLLDESGLGSHPEVIRVFYRAGRAISEDGLVRGGGGGASPVASAAQRMYPGMNP